MPEDKTTQEARRVANMFELNDQDRHYLLEEITHLAKRVAARENTELRAEVERVRTVAIRHVKETTQEANARDAESDKLREERETDLGDAGKVCGRCGSSLPLIVCPRCNERHLIVREDLMQHYAWLERDRHHLNRLIDQRDERVESLRAQVALLTQQRDSWMDSNARRTEEGDSLRAERDKLVKERNELRVKLNRHMNPDIAERDRALRLSSDNLVRQVEEVVKLRARVKAGAALAKIAPHLLQALNHYGPSVDHICSPETQCDTLCQEVRDVGQLMFEFKEALWDALDGGGGE